MSLPPANRAALLNTLAKAQPAKANLAATHLQDGARILRTAIRRSGIQQKELGANEGQVSRQLDGKDALRFHDMLTWPAEVWCELVTLIALEVCPGKFTVERAVTIKEVAPAQKAEMKG